MTLPFSYADEICMIISDRKRELETNIKNLSVEEKAKYLLRLEELNSIINDIKKLQKSRREQQEKWEKIPNPTLYQNILAFFQIKWFFFRNDINYHWFMIKWNIRKKYGLEQGPPGKGYAHLVVFGLIILIIGMLINVLIEMLKSIANMNDFFFGFTIGAVIIQLIMSYILHSMHSMDRIYRKKLYRIKMRLKL